MPENEKAALVELKATGIIQDFTVGVMPTGNFQVQVDLKVPEYVGEEDFSPATKTLLMVLDKHLNPKVWTLRSSVELHPGLERWTYVTDSESSESSEIPEGHYKCSDADGWGGDSLVVQADSPAEAAQDFVGNCDYEPRKRTVWIPVRVLSPDGDSEIIKVEIAPVEPPCTNPEGHNWRTSWSWGSGPGVLILETCKTCGAEMQTDTGGVDMFDGARATVVCYPSEDRQPEE